MQAYDQCVCRHGVCNPYCPFKDDADHADMKPYVLDQDRVCRCVVERRVRREDGVTDVYKLDGRCQSLTHKPWNKYVTDRT